MIAKFDKDIWDSFNILSKLFMYVGLHFVELAMWLSGFKATKVKGEQEN